MADNDQRPSVGKLFLFVLVCALSSGIACALAQKLTSGKVNVAVTLGVTVAITMALSYGQWKSGSKK